MIALTKEKREELAKFAKATLNSLNGIEPENPNQYDDCLSEYTQMCMEIALTSLTAEKRATVDVVGVIWNEWKPEVGTPLFTAPSIPDINKEDYIGLQVSVDVSTCDDDAGHRYFGKVSALSESNGEVVLVIEDPEKNFTAPPVPEIKLSLLQSRDLEALIRFNETCEDCDGYDLSKDKMDRLVELGVVRKIKGGIREITALGQMYIDIHCQDSPSEFLMTETDRAAAFNQHIKRLNGLED